MGAALDTVQPVALDLGSGVGLPGFPLALAWPGSRWFLLDGSIRRAEFLSESVTALGLAERVTVVAERAESAGRGELRSTVDAVFARSFAGPAVTAECASPFLRQHGLLVVAEPPGGRPDRWDVPGLGGLGMQLGPRLVEPTAVQLIVQVTLCPERFPRRVGVPSKRPLF